MKSGLKGTQTLTRRCVNSSSNLCRDEKRTESNPDLRDEDWDWFVATYAAMKSGLKDL